MWFGFCQWRRRRRRHNGSRLFLLQLKTLNTHGTGIHWNSWIYCQPHTPTSKHWDKTRQGKAFQLIEKWISSTCYIDSSQFTHHRWPHGSDGFSRRLLMVRLRSSFWCMWAQVYQTRRCKYVAKSLFGNWTGFNLMHLLCICRININGTVSKYAQAEQLTFSSTEYCFFTVL